MINRASRILIKKVIPNDPESNLRSVIDLVNNFSARCQFISWI